MSIKVSIDYDPRIRGTRIWVVDERQDGLFAAAPTELVFFPVLASEELPPTFTFTRSSGHEFLEELSQALVRAGFKPSELAASNREIGAMSYHLEDMRRLVFKEKNDKQEKANR